MVRSAKSFDSCISSAVIAIGLVDVVITTDQIYIVLLALALFRSLIKIFWVSHRMCRKDVGRDF